MYHDAIKVTVNKVNKSVCIRETIGKLMYLGDKQMWEMITLSSYYWFDKDKCDATCRTM